MLIRNKIKRSFHLLKNYKIFRQKIENTVEPIESDLKTFEKTYKDFKQNPDFTNYKNFLDVIHLYLY